jgi:hypothetical protein
MTRTSLLFSAVMFLAGACGGSDKEPKNASTTKMDAPDEKGEENIQMSPGSAAPAKKATEPKPAEPKPAEPKPAEPAPAPPPK